MDKAVAGPMVVVVAAIRGSDKRAMRCIDMLMTEERERETQACAGMQKRDVPCRNYTISETLATRPQLKSD